ncbi:MAG: hypothetical protein JW740_01360 [Candidatus Zambryskibacteria bacterium]|nr:hypothetical protein [Candidatus Zambryskibacteria bacterium]
MSKITFSTALNCVAYAKNSIGSNIFRNVYFDVDGQKVDLTEDGNLSCAVFVSSILYLLKLIKDTHITVASTLKDMQNSGWFEIQEPKLGCILVWEEKDFGDGRKHKHLGFYVGDDKAVSNNPESGYPTEHDWDEYDKRKVEMIFWNKKLD